MHSALFVAQKPEPFLPLAKAAWPRLVTELRAIALSGQGIEILAENVLLIPLPNCMGQLSEANRAASSMPAPSRTLYFQEAPEWVISPVQNS